jgi:glycosyltransferase involved in cell wall biosynthesis
MVTREFSGDRRYGLGRSLLPVIEALQRQGWRVRYLTQEDLPTSAKAARQKWLGSILRLPGIAGVAQRETLIGALFERLHMGWFAASTASEQQFSTVHLHDPWLAGGFWLGCKWLRLRGLRWGLTEHGFGCYSRATHEDGLIQGAGAQRWLRRLESFVLGKAHWVTAPTQLALDQLARDLALPHCPPHWHSVAHAAAKPISDHPTQVKSATRASLGWTTTDMYIVGVGRLAPLKRFDILVHAWAILATRNPSLHLQILGGGDTSTLQKIADAAGCGDRLHFAVVDDVQPYLSAADIYVSTSQTESFGLANLEALCAGLPSVCTAVGGVPEVVAQGAWLIPVNVDVLTTVLSILVESPHERSAWSLRALERAKQLPDLASIAHRYAAIFQS